MAFLTEAANRGSISTGYDIDNSIQMNSVTISNPPRFNRTNSSAGNRKTFTVSFWHKRGYSAHSNTVGYRVLNSIRNESGKYPGLFVFDYRGDVNSTQFLSAFVDEDENNTLEAWFKSDMSFRDESAWYHIVIAYDTTQATASNRRAMYVNGVLQTFSESGDIPQHHQSSWNDNTLHCIGAYEYSLSDASLGGYLAEVHNIDGLKLDATAFGEFDEDSGIWKPKEYDGNYGTNGFRLQFKETGTGQDANGLGADTSGNNHHFATVGHTAASQATDTPTNNFCTINTPFAPYVGTPPTISEGATLMTGGASGQQDSYGTMALFKGKWYFEFSVLNVGGLAVYNMYGGVVKVNRLLQSSYNNAANGHHSHDGGWGGNCYAVGFHNNTNGGFTSVSGATVDTVIGVAVDMDNGKIWWSSQGTWASSSGTPSNPATGLLPQFTNLLTQYPGEPVVPAYNHYVHQATTQGAFNFGGYQDHAFTDIGTNSDANGYGSFAYTPPSGYYAICTKNLAEYG